jgi:hypothetical protein
MVLCTRPGGVGVEPPDETVDRPETDPSTILRAWIESSDGSISRGLVEALSREGALVELASAAQLETGAEVAVRLSLDPLAPTLGLLARVVSVTVQGGSWQCELAWPEDQRLDSLLAETVERAGERTA